MDGDGFRDCGKGSILVCCRSARPGCQWGKDGEEGLTFGFFGECAGMVDRFEAAGPRECPYLKEVDFFCAFVAFRVRDSWGKC